MPESSAEQFSKLLNRLLTMSIDAKFNRRNNNMDALRYVMAFSVIVAHFNELCGFHISWPISSATGVGGFFALSGFLIYRSYNHSPNLRTFLAKRALRILPPYFLVVLLCAFCLAGVSTLPPVEYFFSAGWLKYVGANLCFLNFLQPDLPGVFHDGRFVTSAVNGALWTMKVEWCLYLTVPVVAWICSRRHFKRSHTIVFSLIIVGSVIYSLLFIWLFATTGKEIYAMLARQFFGQLSFFYIGALAALKLEQWLKHKWLWLALLLTGIALMQINDYVEIALWPFVAGGLVIWTSMVGSWGKYFSQHDNVSYDMYLFHFPILQLCVYFGVPSLGCAACFIIALAATVLLSALSWHTVGKRAQSLKYKLTKC